MGSNQQPNQPEEQDRDLQHALELFECVGAEALAHWISRRGDQAGELTRQLDGLLQTGLLEAPPELDGPNSIDRYRILRRLGSGAMSVIYLAVDDQLDCLVAIKLMSPSLTEDERLRERFRREARTLALLRHANIVPVLAAGEFNGQQYIVLEYIPGISLEDGLLRLRDLQATANGPILADSAREAFRLPYGTLDPEDHPRRVARWIWQLSQALACAHRAGIVHRDVKPANVMIDDHGNARLLDFGLAHVTDDVRMTWSRDMIGTPRYLAPEVVRSGAGSCDHRVDLFALGACLYEALVLVPPFAGVSAAQVLQGILEHDPGPPSRKRSGVPVNLDTITQVALSKDPARRYLDASAMADDLERFLAGNAVQARAPGLLTRVRIAVARKPLAAGLAVLLLLMMTAIASIVLTYNDRLRLRTEHALLAKESTESALGFLEELLELSDVEELGPDVSAKRLLKEGAARVQDPAHWPVRGIVRPRLARTLGSLSWGAGDLVAANDLLELARDLLQAPLPKGINPRSWRLELARSENFRGNVLRARGLPAQAETGYQTALEAVLQVPGAEGREQEATILANLADLLGKLGRLQEAEDFARRALKNSTGDDPESMANRAWGLITLARLQVRRNRIDAARESLQAAHRAAGNTTGRPLQKAMVLDAEAMLAAAVQDHQRAVELMAEVVRVYESVLGPEAAILGEALVGLGSAEYNAGNVKAARAAYQRGLTILDKSAAPTHQKRGTALLELGLLAYDQGDSAEAVKRLSDYMQVRPGEGEPSLEALVPPFTLAAAQAQAGDSKGARATLAKTWARLSPETASRAEFIAYKYLVEARIARAERNFPEARSAYSKAVLGIGEPDSGPTFEYIRRVRAEIEQFESQRALEQKNR